MEFIEKIHKFNLKTRCYGIKRKKGSKKQNLIVEEKIDEEGEV